MDPDRLRKARDYLHKLDLPVGATSTDVKRAYRFQAQNWNPSSIRDNARLQSAAGRRLNEAREAYDWLIENGAVLQELGGQIPDEDGAGSPRSFLRWKGLSPLLLFNGALYVLLLATLIYGVGTSFGSFSDWRAGDIPGSRQIIQQDQTKPSARETPQAPETKPPSGRSQSPPVPGPPAGSGGSEDGLTSPAPPGQGDEVLPLRAGSTKPDVQTVLGPAPTIQRNPSLRQEIWRYPELTIVFSTETELVVSIRPSLDDESHRAAEPAQEFWSLASPKSDVARIQGEPPSSIQRTSGSGVEVWHYGESTVTFSIENDRVVEWDNSGNNLRVRLE